MYSYSFARNEFHGISKRFANVTKLFKQNISVQLANHFARALLQYLFNWKHVVDILQVSS